MTSAIENLPPKYKYAAVNAPTTNAPATRKPSIIYLLLQLFPIVDQMDDRASYRNNYG